MAVVQNAATERGNCGILFAPKKQKHLLAQPTNSKIGGFVCESTAFRMEKCSVSAELCGLNTFCFFKKRGLKNVL